MPTNQTPLQRPRRLSLGHEAEMSLRYGDLAERPAFACDDERREAAWFYHRDRLLMHCSHGQRPAGWWDFESPIPYPEDAIMRRRCCTRPGCWPRARLPS